MHAFICNYPSMCKMMQKIKRQWTVILPRTSIRSNACNLQNVINISASITIYQHVLCWISLSEYSDHIPTKANNISNWLLQSHVFICDGNNSWLNNMTSENIDTCIQSNIPCTIVLIFKTREIRNLCWILRVWWSPFYRYRGKSTKLMW